MGECVPESGQIPTDYGYMDRPVKYDGCWDSPGYSQGVSHRILDPKVAKED